MCIQHRAERSIEAVGDSDGLGEHMLSELRMSLQMVSAALPVLTALGASLTAHYLPCCLSVRAAPCQYTELHHAR